MKKFYLILSSIVLLVFTLSACTKPSQENDDKLNVMVSVLPQVDFVERIGGDKVVVSAMIPPGYSPATYDPSPEQIRKLSDADLYVRIGHIPFEGAQMAKLQDINKGMLVVDSSQGIALREIEAHSHEGDEHEDEHGHEDEDHEDMDNEEEHEEHGKDPHIWLSPNLVKIQAENIYKALVDVRPEDADYFSANKDKFLSDLENLDSKLVDAFSSIEGQTILVFHPAFGYLADAYNFHQEAIEIEGKDPTIEDLQKIIDEAKSDNVKVIFVQKQFSTKSAQVVADAIGGTVVKIDPLDPDYFANMENMAYTIVNSMK